MTYNIDPGLDFENWICYSLPKILNLSPSKRMAVKVKFGGFADHVRQLEREAPKEYKTFYDALIRKFNEISNWRAQNGQKCV